MGLRTTATYYNDEEYDTELMEGEGGGGVGVGGCEVLLNCEDDEEGEEEEDFQGRDSTSYPRKWPYHTLPLSMFHQREKTAAAGKKRSLSVNMKKVNIYFK